MQIRDESLLVPIFIDDKVYDLLCEISKLLGSKRQVGGAEWKYVIRILYFIKFHSGGVTLTYMCKEWRAHGYKRDNPEKIWWMGSENFSSDFFKLFQICVATAFISTLLHTNVFFVLQKHVFFYNSFMELYLTHGY